MLYYSRIQSDGINPLVKEAFNINKNISNENIYTTKVAIIYRKKTKGQTMIYNTLHRKLKIVQYEPYKNGVYSCVIVNRRTSSDTEIA